jgi:hypothetical protein
MLSFAKLAALLIALGPKLPKAWALLQELYFLFEDQITKALDKQAASEGLELVAVSAEDLELESKILQVLEQDASARGEPLQAIDFSRIRRLIKFAQAAGLDTILISILTKAATGG